MTKLQDLRKASGLSQSQLADLSGVNLRSLQYYEQGAKDINKASAQTVFALARALGCRMESLLLTEAQDKELTKLLSEK